MAGKKKKKKAARPRRVRKLKRPHTRKGGRKMARKKKSRKQDRAIPLLLTLPVVVPAIRTYNEVGLSKAFPEYFLLESTGYSTTDSKFNENVIKRQLGLVVAGMVGHKIANRLGINKHLKKMTMGYLKL